MRANALKSRRIDLAGTLACALLVALAFIFVGAGACEASTGHGSHMHDSVSPFDSHKVGGSSCPLLHHHPGKEVCPLNHLSRIDDVVTIKSCGNSPANGVPSNLGFSKETVTAEILCDLRLPLESRQVHLSASRYNSLLSDPLDHPPKSL